MLPGVNGASASAVKSMATDRCIAAGIGRGELSAWLNNLRAIVLATAPTFTETSTHGLFQEIFIQVTPSFLQHFLGLLYQKLYTKH